ncbi:phosphoglycerate dehydrogenase [Sporosalibacterium faouarense]|uniref:phosphoglycerate dehydrogenase n=1 Tax=Sporosalibacterium faouarense TaxID=516123 RepID=UPI00141C4AA4|nr:phosphoglycerate dehydrogenase [Sporosalibacterium faouarense]MTI49186.1 dihydrofolate reductase [Bacillota bacterium]
MKALFTYDYGNEKMDKIRNLGYEITYQHEKSVKYNSNLNDIEILVCYNPFNTLDITKMKGLKWIQLSSIGIDQTPKEYLQKSGIVLTNNRGGYSIPMGEWIVMKSLEMLKNSRDMYDRQRNKKWKMDTSILEIYGKTIGFIGTGSIAKEAAKRFQGFGANIFGLNTSGSDTEYFDKCFKRDDFHKLLALSDVVILTIPYTENTHHMFNDNAFSHMKKNSYLINVSRGSIIDEKSMIKNLENGKISGAALDVFEEEPLSKDNPLWDMKNVIVTPHNSWVSEMRNTRRYNMIYENMKRYINGEDLINVVNLNKGY